MIKLAVFGAPVSQSRSPAIHTLFANQCGIEVDYRAVESTHENFAEKVHELAAAGGAGCNITAPFKSRAWELAQRRSNGAERAGAANTLVFERPGDWFADNTDGRGVLRDLDNRCECEVSGLRVCIIGAGGATAGILGDLLDQDPVSIVIANRTLERAETLAGTFGEKTHAISLTALASAGPFDLVINATSLGHSGDAPELPLSLFEAGSLCYDLNYGRAADPLRRFCDEAGVRYFDGLGMLVEQAALSFELWTGLTPDTGPVLETLRQSL